MVVIQGTVVCVVLAACVCVTTGLDPVTVQSGDGDGSVSPSGDNVTLTDATVGDNNNKKHGRKMALGGGMEPLYAVTNFFLEKVLRPRSVAALRLKVDLSDPRSIYDSLKHNSAMWARHHISFTMMAFAAIIWAVMMPLVGCVVICWCNGGRDHQSHSEYFREQPRRCPRCGCYKGCCRRTLAVLLGVACVGLILGVGIMMVANQLMIEQTLGGAIVNRFVSSLDLLDRYRDDVTATVRTTDSVERKQQRLTAKVDNISQHCQEILDERTGLPDFFDELSTFARSLNDTARLFNDLQQTSDALFQYRTATSANMSTLLNNIRFSLKVCDAQCSYSLQYVNALPSDLFNVSRFSFDEITDVIGDLANGSSDLQTRIGIADTIYKGLLTADIEQSDFDLAVTALRKYARNISVSVRRMMGEATRRVERMFTVAEYKNWITTKLDPWLRRFGAYRCGVGVALCAVVLLPAVGSLVALHFRAWGAASGDDVMLESESCCARCSCCARSSCCVRPACCTRSKASTALLVTASTSLATGWLLALGTCVLFLAGGVLHVDLCRHLSAPSADPGGTAVVLDAVGQWVNASVDLRVVMKACENRQSVFSAFNLVSAPDEIVQLRRLAAPLRGQPNRTVASNTPNNVFHTAFNNIDTTGAIDRLDTALASFDIAAYRQRLSEVPAATELDELGVSIRQTSAILQASGDAAIVASLTRYSEELSRQNAIYVTTVQRYHERIEAAIDRADAWIQSNDIAGLKSRMELARALNVTEVVRLSRDATTNDLLRAFTDVVGELRTEIVNGDRNGCRPVYEALDSLFGAVCVDYLYPFNAFWLVAGTCCFVLLPITVAISLILRRSYGDEEPAYSSRQVSLKQIRMGRQHPRERKRPSLPEDQSSERSVFYVKHTLGISFMFMIQLHCNLARSCMSACPLSCQTVSQPSLTSVCL